MLASSSEGSISDFNRWYSCILGSCSPRRLRIPLGSMKSTGIVWCWRASSAFCHCLWRTRKPACRGHPQWSHFFELKKVLENNHFTKLYISYLNNFHRGIWSILSWRLEHFHRYIWSIFTVAFGAFLPWHLEHFYRGVWIPLHNRGARSIPQSVPTTSPRLVAYGLSGSWFRHWTYGAI